MSEHPHFPEGRPFFRRQTTVDQAHAMMLSAIVDGRLVAGDELHDREWAELLDVSRTPIREAIQRLECHGIVDIAAARYTRLASFTPETARREAHVWAHLHQAIVSTLCRPADPDLIDQLEAAIAAHDRSEGAQRFAASFTFFENVRVEAQSFGLTVGAVAAGYRLRLAAPQLPEHRGADAELQANILTALREDDCRALPKAFSIWIDAVTSS